MVQLKTIMNSKVLIGILCLEISRAPYWSTLAGPLNKIADHWIMRLNLGGHLKKTDLLAALLRDNL